jgi:hypothetical protein
MSSPRVAHPVVSPPVEHPLHGKQHREAKREAKDKDDKADARFDPLDPATRSAAQWAPPMQIGNSSPIVPPAEAVPIAAQARVSIEELLPQLVRRIAWAGDRQRGTVRLELGAGRHAGTVVTVHSEGGRIRLELQGEGAAELGPRIEERLERRGVEVERR